MTEEHSSVVLAACEEKEKKERKKESETNWEVFKVASLDRLREMRDLKKPQLMVH